MGYRFDAKNHVHLFNDKPLYGVTSVLGEFKFIPLYYASGKAVETLGWQNPKYVKDRSQKAEDALKEIKDMDVDGFLGLLDEAYHAHSKHSKDAAQKGTDIHAEVEKVVIEAINKDGFITELPGPEAPKQLQQFINWAIGNKVKFLTCENELHSEEYWIGGICDFTCEMNGKKYVGDLKTSKAIYYEMWEQVAAYGLMMKEEFDGSLIVRAGKDGVFEVKERYDLETDTKSFLAKLTAFKAKKAYEV